MGLFVGGEAAILGGTRGLFDLRFGDMLGDCGSLVFAQLGMGMVFVVVVRCVREFGFGSCVRLVQRILVVMFVCGVLVANAGKLRHVVRRGFRAFFMHLVGRGGRFRMRGLLAGVFMMRLFVMQSFVMQFVAMQSFAM